MKGGMQASREIKDNKVIITKEDGTKETYDLVDKPGKSMDSDHDESINTEHKI